MANRCYLAMTEAEIRRQASLPPRMGYLSCCFSPYGLGLMGVPQHLPPGNVLLLTDRIEPVHHAPVLVARQLHAAAVRLHSAAIVLDLQRPDNIHSNRIAGAVAQGPPCPVVISQDYARDLPVGVLMRVPVGIALEDAITPWQGREMWLEMGMDRAVLEITEQGCTRREPAPFQPDPSDLEDRDLCCRYRLELRQDRADFCLYETVDTWQEKLRKAETLGIRNAIGLYQEFGSGFQLQHS